MMLDVHTLTQSLWEFGAACACAFADVDLSVPRCINRSAGLDCATWFHEPMRCGQCLSHMAS